MRRIYRRLAERQAHLLKRTKVAVATVEARYIIVSIGIATFFFGFFAGALLNLYLIAINHPLVAQFRASLSYKSAILGDGILLPIVNMIVAAFILKNLDLIGRKTVQGALISGMIITSWFHVNQAVNNVVNWAMPEPWHWNILGIWHAMYMFSVAALLSLFYLLVMKFVKVEKAIPVQVFWVTAGIVAFFALLRLDYIDLSLSSLFPSL